MRGCHRTASKMLGVEPIRRCIHAPRPLRPRAPSASLSDFHLILCDSTNWNKFSDNRSRRSVSRRSPILYIDAGSVEFTRTERRTPPCHRRHLRTARRVWRTVVLATQTPLTRVLPGPHAAATCMTMPSGWGIGAGVIACAEVARAKAKPATAINLIILLLLFYRESVTQTPTGAQTRSGSCESFVNCEAARIAYYYAIRTEINYCPGATPPVASPRSSALPLARLPWSLLQNRPRARSRI